MRSIAIAASLACLVFSALNAQPGPTNAKRPFSIHKDFGLDDPRAKPYFRSLDPIDLTPQGKRELTGEQPRDYIAPRAHFPLLPTQPAVGIPAQQSIIATPPTAATAIVPPTSVVPSTTAGPVAVPMRQQVVTPTPPANTTVVVPSTTQPVLTPAMTTPAPAIAPAAPAVQPIVSPSLPMSR